MKKSMWMVALVAATICGNAVLANTPSQDKPASKTTTTTVKKSAPKTMSTTKTVHTKHVKKS